MRLTNQCRQAICYLCTMALCGACTIISKDPVSVDYEMLPDYHFYAPCGQARICGDLEKGGYYLVYVLTDSLDISNCVETITGKDTLPMRFGKDFLITMAVHNEEKDWFFHFEHMEVVDSMLHIHLKASHRNDTTVSTPSYKLSDNYVWKINGQETKLIKLYINNTNYAYVPGPQWSEAPINWEHAHWRESPSH
ncbi:hypothetical protein GFS24_20335 [Chitinophaga sp. SYP-B3965]|uniref:hypothetical protein n=1 Tax=Chitinophaga sp. SYP-B3965 TaxID=2663120 RepID=UPI0012998181|nr:hypothetical protein [Chitinophaga sp. SYP-B3965]MRG47481.1 hypothetical protein [Chitinophaga sp. SYP-B3965]